MRKVNKVRNVIRGGIGDEANVFTLTHGKGEGS